MKKLFSFAFPLLMLASSATAQKKDKDLLTGTWYAKLPAYKFHQDGTAIIYTKSMVNNPTQKLVIEKDSTYNYYERSGSDSIIVTGKLSISNDTLIFTLASTNHAKYKYYTTLKHYLYQLNKSYLVYSFAAFPPTAKMRTDDNKTFSPVETSAYYKEGEHQFLKSLYSQLLSAKPANADSVYLNSYSLTINEDGSFNSATLFEMSGRPEYFSAIKKALQNLDAPFVAAVQNGKNVKGRKTFKITY